MGFADGREFVNFVLENLDAVYEVDGKRKYDLVSRARTPQGRVMIRLEFAENGDYYSVATAGPVRPEYYHKKTPLWERAQSNHSVIETPGAVSGQSGVLNQQEVPADDATISLTHKGVKPASPRASYLPVVEAKGIIRFFESADISSAGHEIGHVLRRVPALGANMDNAPDFVRRDRDTRGVADLKVSDGARYTTPAGPARVRPLGVTRFGLHQQQNPEACIAGRE